MSLHRYRFEAISVPSQAALVGTPQGSCYLHAPLCIISRLHAHRLSVTCTWQHRIFYISCCHPGPGLKRDIEPGLMLSVHCCCRYEAALQKANEAAAALRPGVKRDPEPKEEVIGDDDDDEDLQVCTCKGCI